MDIIRRNHESFVAYTSHFDNFTQAGADLGFLKRQSKILDSDSCDVIVMTSPI